MVGAWNFDKFAPVAPSPPPWRPGLGRWPVTPPPPGMRRVTAGGTWQFSFRAIMTRKEYSLSFRCKCCGVHGGMSQKMACHQLDISRSQLHVWLKRDKLGIGLQTEPGRGHQTATNRLQNWPKGWSDLPMMVHRHLRNNPDIWPFKLISFVRQTKQDQYIPHMTSTSRGLWSKAIFITIILHIMNNQAHQKQTQIYWKIYSHCR